MRAATCHPDKKHYCKGVCVRCYKAAQRERNAESMRAYQAAWYVANREKQRARSAAWCLSNPGKASASRKAWRIANTSKMRPIKNAWMAAWRIEHRDVECAKSAAWRAANPEKVRAMKAKRRAALKGLTVPGQEPTAAELKRLLANKLCHYCKSRPASDIDHVVPLARGGLHIMSNLVPACRTCNTSKGAKLLSEWSGPTPVAVFESSLPPKSPPILVGQGTRGR